MDMIPRPWIPADGDVCEIRLRNSDRWIRGIWRGWSRINPSMALVHMLTPGARWGDVIVEMRPAEGACEHHTAFQCSAISGLPSCGRILCFNCEAPVTADEVRTIMRTCRQCSSKPTDGV